MFRSGSRLTAFLALSVLGASLCACGIARGDKGITDGTFEDRERHQHSWSIERSHLLSWEGKPYAPAGIVFHSAYLKSPSAEALKQDEAALDRLKAEGISDLWIDPQRGLLETSPSQTQAVLDAVEARGLRYGLRVGDRPHEALVGFAPRGDVLRVPADKLQPGAKVSWNVPLPSARRAAFLLAESNSSNERDDRMQYAAMAAGDVVVEKDTAQIEVQLKRATRVGRSRGLLYVVPEVRVEPEDLGSFGDLWSGMTEYNGRLKRYFQALKFGPGFRFVLDPFAAGDGTMGREDEVFPSSEPFRQAFQEWLRKRSGIQTLNINWRTADKRIQGVEEASRLIPTWSRNDPPEGDGWLLDPVAHVAYRCKPRQSKIWEDLDDFRAETLKRWLNVTAVAVKGEGANVPVVFSWSAYHPVFNNSPSISGYDGLGAQLSGDAGGAARESGGYALAQVEEADRNTWLFASRLTGPPDDKGKPAPIGDAARLEQLWETLRGAGFRGIYLDPALEPNAVSLAKGLAATMNSSEPALQQRAAFLLFPLPLATADRVTRFSNGVWWLPTSSSGRLLRYGASVQGYTLDKPFGEESSIKNGAVLWSMKGNQEVSFFVDKLSNVEFYDTLGRPLKIKPKKNEIRVPLSSEPVVATGVDLDTLFPIELAQTALKEFDDLLSLAEAQKRPEAQMRPLYTDAKKNLTADSASQIYQAVSANVNRLRDLLAPFVWIEGEKPVGHNFSGVAFYAGASGNYHLKLDRRNPPPNGVYKARYAVPIRQDGTYEVWVAGRLPGSAGVSPLVWEVDDEPAVEVRKAESVGGEYTRGMGWYQLSRLALKAGMHELTLVVPERAAGPDGHFAMGIDAIVFSRQPFKPNGTEKPYGMLRAPR